MVSQLTEWESEARRIEEEVRRDLGALSEAQFAWRPGEGRWTIGECVDHLAITTELVVSRLKPAIAEARRENRTSEPPFKFGLLGGWFVRMMETPGKRGMKSPSNFVPTASPSKGQALTRFAAAQKEFAAALESARGLALDKVKAPSSARGAFWFRLNLAAWFAGTLAHDRRHLAQARRVKETPGFPR